MKLIPLTQGKSAIVDDEDYSYLSQFKWFYKKNKNGGYAARTLKTIRMHRVIMNAESSEEVDHINKDGLDNRKTNLRKCSREENVRNVAKRKDTLNKYKGVHFIKKKKHWIARIQINGKRIHSGYFVTEIEAAKEYDKLAKNFHGMFASLNFPY